jgi:uncharacterized OsmC-like protein
VYHVFDTSSPAAAEGSDVEGRPAPPINGIDLAAVGDMLEGIRTGTRCATAGFRVTTRWKGQTRSESTVESFTCAGEPLPRSFAIAADEPRELLGSDSAPNPQELLLSAVNACLMVGYVVRAAARGITLPECRVETEGEIDLRGLLGLDEDVPAGYRRINYTVHLEGDGTPEQYDEIHRAVIATCPNYFNLAQPVQMCGRLA